MPNSLKLRKQTPSVASSDSTASQTSGLPQEIMRASTWMFSYNMKNLIIFVMLFGILITTLNIYQLRHLKNEHLMVINQQRHIVAPQNILYTPNAKCTKPKVWIRGSNIQSGYLHHVISAFRRLGFDDYYGEEDFSFNVLWSHEYPFFTNSGGNILPHKINENQMINHFPGCGFFTNKVYLATSGFNHTPPAFKLPEDKAKLLNYVELNPKSVWVQKNNMHRGVKVIDVAEINFNANNIFIQEYVTNPLLIDGRKFDIGIYAIMTSLNPLSVYLFEGEALLRFCAKPYLPFNRTDIISYVVGDDYSPTWEIPSMKKAYGSGLSMKESLNLYLRGKGLNPDKMWQNIRDGIAEVYIAKEYNMIDSAKVFHSTSNFFEMVRFDFVVDENLNVYLMEANMSPNLSSNHFAANRPTYEKVIFNVLNLVGVAFSHLSKSEIEMKVSDRELIVNQKYCASDICQNSCQDIKCRFCIKCLSESEKEILRKAYNAHLSRWECRRIIPQPTNQAYAESQLSNLTPDNFNQSQLLKHWFYGKCVNDASWCT